MARIKINIPSESIFSTEICLTINFINYGGHMGNDAILTLCQDARIQYLKELNFTELDYYGKSLIQADAAIVFKSEAFHGDKLDIKLYINDLNEYGFDFIYSITNLNNNREVARSKTGMVFFDYEKRKISKAPKSFIENFKKL